MEEFASWNRKLLHKSGELPPFSTRTGSASRLQIQIGEVFLCHWNSHIERCKGYIQVLDCRLLLLLLLLLFRPPLWSGGQTSWLQIKRPGFDYRRYQIFWEVVGLERGPLSLVSTTEELLGRKISDCGLETRDYGRRDPLRWPRGTFYRQKLALTSPTSGRHSVGIVFLRTQATEFSFSF
jgi:hypothetical protein